jgi:hypothetical protein
LRVLFFCENGGKRCAGTDGKACGYRIDPRSCDRQNRREQIVELMAMASAEEQAEATISRGF